MLNSQQESEFDERGYVVFPELLERGMLDAIRAALKPWLDEGPVGRNAFEGRRTQRVYALLAKSPIFSALVLHPKALTVAESLLGASCRLSACLAINLHPGEQPQPWHYDDAHIDVPRPRRAYGLSAFWAIDDVTELNGATEVLPGSHLWTEEDLERPLRPDRFVIDAALDASVESRFDDSAVKVVMPAGSLMLAQGTLWHRGGANRSEAPRLIITPQYCPGWARQLENMVLTMPSEQAATLPERAQELLGYSVHPPFMGYVDGRHPKKAKLGG